MRAFFMATAVAVLIPAVAQADPIIQNPGFELGNTGFTSNYNYVPPPITNTNLVPEGTYTVGNNSSQYNFNWTTNVTAHTGSNFMIVNGDPNAGVTVYDQTGITVLPNTQYFFEAWVTALNPASPAVLQFSINGQNINAPLTISTTVGLWQELFVEWDSGPSTTLAEITLLNENTVRVGNDFGLDDISLTTMSPVPEPLTLSLFGAGLAGVAGVAALRRRKKA
jgi:hypothetical protein